MATRTKPLMTAAALVSAAAVAVATPAIAPSVVNPTSPALSSAKVELANFADLLSITPADWNYYYFTGWGGAIGPINVDPQNPQSDYWLPNCNYDCTIPGVSGVAYLALDALINGNGQGINDAPNWNVSAVNYFFEGGLSTGLQYIVQKPFVTEGSPLYNPAIGNLIALAFQGPYALTTLFVTGLSIVASAAANIPFIGEYLYHGIGSYIGPAFQNIDTSYDYSYYAGWSGVLRYVTGVITTGGNPNPYPLLQTSSTPLAAKAPAVTAASAQTAVKDAASIAAAPSAETVSGTKVEAASTEATTTPAESASSTATAVTTTAGDTKPAEVASSTAANAVADAPAAAAPATKPADAAPTKSRKRPVRDAVAGVAKTVTSAVSGATAKAAGTGSATGGADAAN